MKNGVNPGVKQPIYTRIYTIFGVSAQTKHTAPQKRDRHKKQYYNPLHQEAFDDLLLCFLLAHAKSHELYDLLAGNLADCSLVDQ